MSSTNPRLCTAVRSRRRRRPPCFVRAEATRRSSTATISVGWRSVEVEVEHRTADSTPEWWYLCVIFQPLDETRRPQMIVSTKGLRAPGRVVRQTSVLALRHLVGKGQQSSRTDGSVAPSICSTNPINNTSGCASTQAWLSCSSA